jgi:hypothetical protein
MPFPAGVHAAHRLGDQDTQRLGPTPTPEEAACARADRTMKIQKLDPSFKPEETQRIDPQPRHRPLEGSAIRGETTQRIDDSIWRLQEAKRILKGITPK